MKSVNIHETKTHFSALLARVEAGELGWDSGLRFWIAEDFDEYIPG
jgi:hypothetical protein